MGLLISFNLYFKSRKMRFVALILGWAVWTITGLLPIISDYISQENLFLSELILVLNAIFGTLGFVLIIAGVMAYFTKSISIIPLTITSLALLVFPLLIFLFTNYRSAVLFSGNLLIVLYFLTLIIALKERKQLVEYLGNSINFLYGLAGFILVYIAVYIFILPKGNFTYGLYLSNDLFSIFIYYTFAIGATILFLLLLFQIETGIASNTRIQLTDRYSHDLGNIMQIILTSIETMEISKDENIKSIELIKQKSMEAGNLINEIRQL
jgi:hypothetical protein